MTFGSNLFSYNLPLQQPFFWIVYLLNLSMPPVQGGYLPVRMMGEQVSNYPYIVLAWCPHSHSILTSDIIPFAASVFERVSIAMPAITSISIWKT